MHVDPTRFVAPDLSTSQKQQAKASAPPKDTAAAQLLEGKPMAELKGSVKNFQLIAIKFLNALGAGEIRGAALAAPILFLSGLDVASSATGINAQLRQLGVAGLTQSLLAFAATKQSAEKPVDFDKLDEAGIKKVDVTDLTEKQTKEIGFHLTKLEDSQLKQLDLTRLDPQRLDVFLEKEGSLGRFSTPQLKALQTALKEPLRDDKGEAIKGETGQLLYHPLYDKIRGQTMMDLDALLLKREP